MAITYSSRQLFQVCHQTSKSVMGFSRSVFYDLKQLGICNAPPTHRGTTGGRRQCRWPETMQSTSMNTTVSSLNDNSDTSTQLQIPKKMSPFVKILSTNCNSINVSATTMAEPAATTILTAAEMSPLAATKLPLADNDTVNESYTFGGDLSSGLRSVQWNARSVYPKIDELRLIMGNSKRETDVLGITETWLNTTYSDSSVAIDVYNLERRDRPAGRSGRVAVYLHDGVP